jgi:hypothetical protein
MMVEVIKGDWMKRRKGKDERFSDKLFLCRVACAPTRPLSENIARRKGFSLRQNVYLINDFLLKPEGEP